MTTPGPARGRRLMVIVNEDACFGRTPMYIEIVQRVRRAGLAGASVFRGIEGFGSTREIRTSRILSLAENLPAMIVIIDTAEKIDRFLPQLSEIGVHGVVALDDVDLVQPGWIPPAARP